MEIEDFDPAKLAHPSSGFRFPVNTPLSKDVGTTELRLLVAGWASMAEKITRENIGIQELRDVVFRMVDLTVALSARELTFLKELQQKIKDQTTPNAVEAPAAKKRSPRKPKAAV